MKASDLLVKCLEKQEVEYIFGVPGEENLDFLESLSKSNIKFVTTRHEQAAGFMAATYGRLTGRAGVCLSTLGPGATNFVTAAAYAQLGGMPMLMITGQKPINKSKQGRFQIVDTVEIMRPSTKFSKQIINPHSIPAVIQEAFRLAEAERPGAVHVVLPEDVAAMDADAQPFTPNKVRRPVAEEKAIKQAVEMIQEAKMPLLLIGAGANRKLTSKMLTEFIEKTGIYFFSTQMGKGVIDERSPYYLGTAALSANDFIHCATSRADLIINVGHDIIEKPPFIMDQNSKQQVIHINFEQAYLDNIYFPQHEVVGDIANAIWQIKEALAEKHSWDFSYYQKLKTKLEIHLKQETDNVSFPLKPQRIVSEVRKIMPEDAYLALDNGMYKLWFTRNYHVYQRNSLLVDNALATMGAGLPSAMMTKLLYPDKKVVAIVGDGGFMMNSQELETAMRLNLGLVIIILNDNGYGMIKWKQESQGLKNFALEFGNPDFVKYAESYGAKGYKINSSEDFSRTLADVINKNGVHILDVSIDYSENIKVFTEELKTITCDL